MHLPEPEVGLAAGRREHIIDHEFTHGIRSFPGHPRRCPHGEPIPVVNCRDVPSESRAS